jgi:hypothetical protein
LGVLVVFPPHEPTPANFEKCGDSVVVDVVTSVACWDEVLPGLSGCAGDDRVDLPLFPGGKEALAASVIESTGVVYRELFEAIAAEADDVASAFADFFAGAADVLIETDFIDPCPIGTVAREVASTNELVRKAAEAAFDSWVRSATETMVSAGIEPKHAADLATLFVATTEGCFVLCRTKRSTEPLDAVGRLIVPLVTSTVEQVHDPHPA